MRRFQYAKHDTFEILQNVIVCETKHAITPALKPSVPARVGLPLCFEIVALTIKLNNEPSGMRDKIGDVSAYRRLTPKRETIETMGLEVSPQHGLGACHRPTQLSCSATLYL